MAVSNSIIIVDGNRDRRKKLAAFLKASHFYPQTASSLTEKSMDLGLRRGPGLVIISIKNWNTENLKTFRKKAAYLGVILLTDGGSVGQAHQLLEKNLVDHIHDPTNLAGILAAVRSELHRLGLKKKNQAYLKTISILKADKQKNTQKNIELEEIYRTTLENLMTALDVRDVETFGHSRTVAKYTQVLARIMGITDENRLENIRRGALLHDIGKIAIPDAILKKPGPLSPMEWQRIRLHPSLGFGLIKEIKMVDEVGDIILYHHERFDGKGYPEGLEKNLIPIEARIFSLADALDAITSHRPYRQSKSFSEAKKEIRSNAEEQFDPAVVEAFCSLSLSKWEKIRYETTKLLPSFEMFMEANK